MSTHTSTRKVSTLEVIQTGARRRWTAEEKLRIVAESFSARRMVKPTARRYGLSTGQLYLWRRQAREGRLSGEGDGSGFMPAIIVPDAKPSVSIPPSPAGPTAGRPRANGEMVIVLAGGHRVIVDHDVDGAALRRVIEVLELR
jgi:transposase